MASKENIPEEDRTQAGLECVSLNHLISKLGMRTLRLLFRERYKTLTQMDWENGSVTLNQADFIKKLGSNLTLTTEQKFALDSADINNWDFTLLITILMSIGSKISKWNEVGQNISAEDEALKKLRYVRNYLEQGCGQGNQNNDSGWQWHVAKEALLRLGAREKDIDHFRTTPRLEIPDCNDEALDEENEKKAKALRSRAEKLIAAGEFGGGIQLYSEALLLVSLSPKEKSWLYSGRSQAYINQLEDQMESLGEDVIQNYKDVAMEDANRVIQLQPKYWKGYYLQGKCFQLQTLLREAIDSFEVALSLQPGSEDSEEIATAREACRLKVPDVDDIVLDVLYAPNNRLEGIRRMEEVRDLIEVHEELTRSSDPVNMARGCVFMGHRHLHGEGVSPDKKKAVEFFQEAAKAGSPGGALSTGLCYLRGIGVKQNISEAFKYFKAAANQQVRAAVQDFDLLDNEAVAKAKAMLGIMYRNGFGKHQNYATAAKWFTQSALEGFSTAARHVARMHAVGMGIPLDLKRALQYQKLALELGSYAEDMYFLARQYATLGDLTQARYWYDRAIASGYTVADSDRQHFENLLHQKLQEFGAFKKKIQDKFLNSGVPIHVLHERYFKRNRPDASERMKLLQEVILHVLSNISDSPVNFARTTDFKTEELEKFASEGQEYARILLDAINHFNKGVEAIRLLINLDCVIDEASSSQKEILKKLALAEFAALKKLALAEFAACETAQVSYAVDLPADCRAKLQEVAMEFFNKGQRSDSDLHARVCLLLLQAMAFEKELNFVESSKRMYPELPYFHVLHVRILGLHGEPEKGVEVAEESLKLFPDNAELLFYRAGYLSGSTEAIEMYQEFIWKAPSGHRHIPEAYFLIAELSASEGNFEDFEAYYSLGLEAEKNLLSKFLPYESSFKKAGEQIQKLVKGANNSFCSGKVIKRLVEEDPEEMKENRNLKLTNPKRIVAVKECRSRFASIDLEKIRGNALGFPCIPSRAAGDGHGQHKQRVLHPEKIPSLKIIRFADMDPTINRIYKGRVINLTIMEEYIHWITDCVHSVVKDDHDDFNVISFHNFDRSQPSTKKKLGFGSRIRLMNPYLVPRTGGPAVRVDDPDSVILVSSGEENPICRYCWKPSPGLRCIKCKTAQYCSKNCQEMDWKVLGHKELCSVISKNQKGMGSDIISLENLKIC